MKPLLLLLIIVVLSAGCIQPQVQGPYPTPAPSETQPPSSPQDTFSIQDTHRYLSYWNDKMGWNLTNETVAERTADLDRYLETTWEKDSRNYYRVENNSDFLYAVKDIIPLTGEQFAELVTADAEQHNLDRLNYHSHTSRLYPAATT